MKVIVRLVVSLFTLWKLSTQLARSAQAYKWMGHGEWISLMPSGLFEAQWQDSVGKLVQSILPVPLCDLPGMWVYDNASWRALAQAVSDQVFHSGGPRFHPPGSYKIPAERSCVRRKALKSSPSRGFSKSLHQRAGFVPFHTEILADGLISKTPWEPCVICAQVHCPLLPLGPWQFTRVFLSHCCLSPPKGIFVTLRGPTAVSTALYCINFLSAFPLVPKGDDNSYPPIPDLPLL